MQFCTPLRSWPCAALTHSIKLSTLVWLTSQRLPPMAFFVHVSMQHMSVRYNTGPTCSCSSYSYQRTWNENKQEKQKWCVTWDSYLSTTRLLRCKLWKPWHIWNLGYCVVSRVLEQTDLLGQTSTIPAPFQCLPTMRNFLYIFFSEGQQTLRMLEANSRSHLSLWVTRLAFWQQLHRSLYVGCSRQLRMLFFASCSLAGKLVPLLEALCCKQMDLLLTQTSQEA